MNIEEHIKNLKKYIEEDFAFREPIKNMSDFDRYCWNHCKDIETLLTAYEKEKETSHYNQNQLDIANTKLVEEKEKNKKAIDFINNENNYFEDGENWQNILKIKEILEE